MADKPEYQWWNPFGAFSDPINKATIDAQNAKDEEYAAYLAESLRKPNPTGLVKNPVEDYFTDYTLKNWDAETKILANRHRDGVKQDYPTGWQHMGRGMYRDEYGDHSGELYEPATDAQIANHLRFNNARQPLYQWDLKQDTSKVGQGIIEPPKYWTSGQDTWDMIFGNGGATIDSQNKEDKKPPEISTLAPIASTAAPKKPEPEPYKIIPYKFDRITDVIERIETFAHDQTPEERMKAKPGGSKKNPAIGPHHAREIFHREVNRLNHTLKRNPKAPIYTWKDNEDYNKSREMINSFFEAIYPDLKKKLGKEPTDEDYAISYNQGGVRWAHNPEEYRRLYRQNLKIDLESKAKKKKKEEEAKKKEKAEAAA